MAIWWATMECYTAVHWHCPALTPDCVCPYSLLPVQVGTGDRSEKIKTYNYKDSRVSDHRLKLNFDLNKTMDGEFT